MKSKTRSTMKEKSTDPEEPQSKRRKELDYSQNSAENDKPGKIKRILMRNFMCHDALEVQLNPHVNFVVGRNGSGKSAILTALTVGLGARANVTSRGSSLKGFIKKGKNVATIEVTLFNDGPMAYKPHTYGNTITILRTIGTTSSYKIKNSKGEVISTRRNELDNILRAMNIQIDNPISILNQDISRTFLVSSKPQEKYELFMKATLLDVIGNNYKEAEVTCQEEYESLKRYNNVLSEAREEVDDLKARIRRAEEIDKERVRVQDMELELCWAHAIAEEQNLEKVRANYKKYEDNLKQLIETESSVNTKEQEINKKIQVIRDKIKETEQEAANCSEGYNKIRQEYTTSKEAHMTKTRDCRYAQTKIKRLIENINMIRKEIHRLEGGDKADQNEKMKQQLSDFEQKLDEVEAMLRTKQTDQMHLEADKIRLSKDMQAHRIEVGIFHGRIQKLKTELDRLAIQEKSGNALAVFGQNIPRLLRRIEEEYSNKRFQKKPCGPLGAYIKMKDPEWTAAVESYLGAGMFSAFCVDNSNDFKVLSSIISEIYLNTRAPQIICTKFFERVHDVTNHCTRAPGYSNLLDAMEISDPVVANCIIDQREVECVLLIPTTKEACNLMSDATKVPRNCKRGLSKMGDTYYPVPRYRTYGGPRSLRAKFLQVSTTDAMNGLHEELLAVQSEKKTADETYRIVCEKEKRSSSELKTVNEIVTKLRVTQNHCKTAINDLRDKIEENEGMSISVFRNELTELEKKVQQEKTDEARLQDTVRELQQNVVRLEEEFKRQRVLRQNLDTIIEPLKDNITQLEDKKYANRAESQYAAKGLASARQVLQNATAEYERQQRVTERAVSEAMNQGERIDTRRSVKELERLFSDLKGKILEIERQFGTIEDLHEELKEKEAKCATDLALASKIEKSYKSQIKRMKNRKELFSNMKRTYGVGIQESFANVLALRNKRGVIKIDHTQKTLELEVSSKDDAKRPTQDTKSLSGGERSYSTVAFILALWDCTGLPFYFLDEFDVFMDKINRRVIMDILMEHTKSHPQCQFTFLTPLDTSNILAEDYVTIHQLAEPERASQRQ